jgi:hypothetical protein
MPAAPSAGGYIEMSNNILDRVILGKNTLLALSIEDNCAYHRQI